MWNRKNSGNSYHLQIKVASFRVTDNDNYGVYYLCLKNKYYDFICSVIIAVTDNCYYCCCYYYYPIRLPLLSQFYYRLVLLLLVLLLVILVISYWSPIHILIFVEFCWEHGNFYACDHCHFWQFCLFSQHKEIRMLSWSWQDLHFPLFFNSVISTISAVGFHTIIASQ